MAGRSPEGHRIEVTLASAREVEADLFIVGPEQPLVDGLADELRSLGRVVLGPGADGARLEGSKAFMKEVATAAGVPTARHAVVESVEQAATFFASEGHGPYVVKTDGLAAGKGVLVTGNLEEALFDVEAKLSGRAFGPAGRRVVVEEAMTGPELSLLVLCDGTRALPLPVAQDHKRLGEGDKGPNTGGMGAYSPVPFAGSALVEEAMDNVVEPTLAELRRRGIDYRGVLYAGLMCTEDGLRLVEYNVRLGDPEAEVVLPRVEGDLVRLFYAAASGHLVEAEGVSRDATVCAVLAAQGYPAAPVLGARLRGVDQAGTVEGVTVLHAATSLDATGELHVAGGRVLAVVAKAQGLAAARTRVYEAIDRIELPGGQVRRDIAAFAAEEERALAEGAP
jgi:phosphoribosylamine--glycine ligase